MSAARPHGALHQVRAAVQANLVPGLVRDVGLDANGLGLLTGVYMATFALAQLPVGMALDRWGPRRVQLPMLALAALGGLLFAMADTFTGLLLAPMKAPLLWACLLGVGPSTFPLALTLINLRTRTPTGSAALSGFMQGVGYSFSCLGPFLVGWLHTVSNGWTLPFSFLFGCATLMLCASWVACKPRKLEDLW